VIFEVQGIPAFVGDLGELVVWTGKFFRAKGGLDMFLEPGLIL
jgi:hypothetical protein